MKFASKITVFSGFAVFLMLIRLPCPAEETPKEPEKIRALFLYGGHDFDEKAMFAMLDSFTDVTYDKAEMPKALDLFRPGLEKKYDCLLMYDSFKFPFTKEQTDGFKALLDKGIGLLVLHHSTWGFNGWEDFANISGAQHFHKNGYTVNGKECVQSIWAHDQDIRVKVADKNHPIMEGVDPEFTIVDETYGKGYIHPGIHVLWTTDHPKSEREIAWTWKYGKSPVFTTLQGHDARAYENPNFRRTVHQAIRWTVAELRKEKAVSTSTEKKMLAGVAKADISPERMPVFVNGGRHPGAQLPARGFVFFISSVFSPDLTEFP